MTERDDGLFELGTMPSTDENDEAQDELNEADEERLNTEVDAAPAPAPAPATALKEEPLKNDIAFNIASAILHCMQTTFNNNSIYIDTEKSGYIQGIVKTKLSDIPITQKHATEIFKLIEKMKITLAQEKIEWMKVKYTFTFDLHDSKGFFDSDSSQERCSGIKIFIDLINNLKDKLTEGDESTLLFKRIGLDVNGIVVSAKVEFGGSSLMKSKLLCISKQKYYKGSGGSKSRRRHRRKPARKTRRGRVHYRKSKSKSKTKTHRRKRHSRVRKHKKNTYTRRR
jgi:hypothetical protein